jgi:hypothetical protein
MYVTLYCILWKSQLHRRIFGAATQCFSFATMLYSKNIRQKFFIGNRNLIMKNHFIMIEKMTLTVNLTLYSTVYWLKK